MPKFIKHVGVDGKGKKCIVVFREVPGDASSALIVLTETLPSQYHDDLINVIESVTAQESTDISDFLFRQKFKDGTNMLNTMHQNGWLVKVTTKSVMMTPQPGVSINLAELNSQLRLINHAPKEAQDVAESKNPPGILTDKQIADRFRAQARTFEIEAKRLREEADKLDPKDQTAPNLTPIVNKSEKRGRGRPTKATTAA